MCSIYNKTHVVSVGQPLNITKVEDPTADEIAAIHEKFVEHLIDLFEHNKHRYINDADNIHLELS